ncbi:membrane protein [Gordonia phage TZGordon]|uniref:Membrane protein n=1 Tax=Gordonia phage TZGordon TaxID=2744004 RepID=A0A6N0A7V2_9CAUD|nr:membrane protein [Gordonia phage TZGordon]QKO02948.1 membrane protein [Gordonia phage TZGordon]
MIAASDTVDVSAHPVIVWLAIAGAAVGALAVIIPKVGGVVRGVIEDAETRRLARLAAEAELDRQRIEHVARIEAAAAILNDQRVVALTNQLDGISAQLSAQRDRYEQQIEKLSQQLRNTQDALDEALAEIGSLRDSLNAYRDAHDGDRG